MELFNQFLLTETQKRSAQEVNYVVRVISEVYKQWKVTKRRKNAVDLITTSVNKISNINPAILEHLHDPAKLKLTTILMRCMDNPCWMPVSHKAKTYKKLYPLLNALQNRNPQTPTNGLLKDIIMTRLSACISAADGGRVFVGYEPVLPDKYLKYLFATREVPEKTFKMQGLLLPEDFDTLVDTLTINHRKCLKKLGLEED